MVTISVPYNDMLTAARSLREQANIIRVEIQRLDEAVHNIQWMSTRAQGFFQSWDSQRPNMNNWATKLESFALELETQARNMQAADTQS